METFPQELTEHAIVVVMGDIGRSPRMCYHALSLASHGMGVDLVGYVSSSPHENILSNKRISQASARLPIKSISPSVTLYQIYLAFFCGFLRFDCEDKIARFNHPYAKSTRSSYNAFVLFGANFIIDWHNYTFSILEMQNGTNLHQFSHSTTFAFIREQLIFRFLKIVAWWEGYWGRKARWNLCVSHAMQADLKARFNVNALTLYDKAPSWIFRPMSVEERHYFLIKLLSHTDFKSAVKKFTNYADRSKNNGNDDPSESSIFSRLNSKTGKVELLPSRPFFLVSSTSWTLDENFNILFDALKDYERHAQSAANTTPKDELPNLLVVITGKGPLRDEYVAKFSKFHSGHVQVVSVWLSANDYPKILASADLGVSLHTSSSGLDLPMKVVDMFGCHLPVLAKRFRAISELITNGTTGLLFDSHQDLKRSLVELAAGFPDYADSLKKLKSSFTSQLQASWEEQWDAAFWPLIAPNFSAQLFENKRWLRFQNVNIGNKQKGLTVEDVELFGDE